MDHAVLLYTIQLSGIIDSLIKSSNKCL